MIHKACLEQKFNYRKFDFSDVFLNVFTKIFAFKISLIKHLFLFMFKAGVNKFILNFSN